MIKDNPKIKIFITSETHTWCDEWELFLKQNGITKIRHWKGWTWMCPLYNDINNRNLNIEKLHNYKISTKYICTYCNNKDLFSRENCPYRKQFEDYSNVNVIISPIVYVHTKYPCDFAPDYIIVDDCLKEKSDLHTIEELDQFLKAIEEYQTKKFCHTTMAELLTLGQKEFESFMSQLKSEYELLLNFFIESILTCENPSQFIPIILPEEIEEYYRCRTFLGKLKTIGIPALFPLFNYIAKSGANLRIIDARFKKELMDLWVRRYKLETGVKVTFVPDNVEWKVDSKDSIVYQVKGHTFFAPGALANDKKLREKTQAHASMIAERDYTEIKVVDVGAITSQCFIPPYDFLPDRFYNAKYLHYNDLCGKNDLANCKLGYIFGTYLSYHFDPVTKEGGIVEDFRRMFCVDPSIEYVNSKPHGGNYIFKDKGLDAWRWLHEDYEMYQAIHRFRPLRQKCDIILYGLGRTEIEEDGIKVIDIPFKIGGDIMKEREEWLLKFVKVHNNHIPEEIARNEMATEFKISSDRAYRAIKEIVNENDNLYLEHDWLVLKE